MTTLRPTPPALHAADAADAVRGLRAVGHTVLLHCVAAEQRAPSVAVACGVLLGHGADETRQAVRAGYPTPAGSRRVWDVARSCRRSVGSPG